MTAFRCTAKLPKAMKGKPVAAPGTARNRLGEWTAMLVLRFEQAAGLK